MKTVEERVRAGAALLDARRPGWRAEVDAASLDIHSGWRCVLGQLYGDYPTGKAVLGLDGDARQYGFTTSYDLSAVKMADDLDALTAAWQRYLTAAE